MNEINQKCPECQTTLPEDFVKCPACNAYVLDASPWKGERHLFVMTQSLLSWLIIMLILPTVPVSISGIFDDAISQLILLFAIYGMLLTARKWRIGTRQIKAFRLVRQLCPQPRRIDRPLLAMIRSAILRDNLGPYNQLIVYQRLYWLSESTQRKKAVDSTTLESMKHHSETDWESLEGSFTMAQYLIWLLPTAGFLGTVFGMTRALESFSSVVAKSSDLGFTAGLTATAQGLGIAFHTTLVGLAAVIPLLALSTAVKRRSQLFLEQTDRFFLRLVTQTENSPSDVVNEIDDHSTSAHDESADVIAADVLEAGAVQSRLQHADSTLEI